MPTSRSSSKAPTANVAEQTTILSAVILFAIALAVVVEWKSPFIIAVAAVPLMFGLLSFGPRQDTQPEPEAAAFDIDLYGTVLKTGIPFSIHVEVAYLPAPGPPRVLERIKSRLQRAINMHASKTEKLSDDPFTEFDDVLQAAIDPLPDELGLDEITLYTVNVKVEGDPEPPQTGAFI